MVQDIIGNIALVHGEGNVPRQRTVYYWLEDINAGRFELSKGALLCGTQVEQIFCSLSSLVKIQKIVIGSTCNLMPSFLTLCRVSISIDSFTFVIKLDVTISLGRPGLLSFDNSKRPALMSSSQ